MLSIGIDPGKKGGIALINSKTIKCFPLPFIGDELDIVDLEDAIIEMTEQDEDKKTLVVLEKVHAMPGQGVCSMFTFGKNYGELRGMIKIMGLPFIEPTPQAWKKSILAGMDWKGNKQASCEYVMRKFPEVNLFGKGCRKPHDGMADALCLAEFGMKELRGEK